MLYVLFGKIGGMAGKAVKAFKLVLDIASLLRLLIGAIGAGAVAAVIAYIKEMPWWVLVLLFLAILAVTLLVIAWTIRASSGDKRFLKYPDILKALDNRNTKLARKVAKQEIDNVRLEKFAKDLTELLKITPRTFTSKRLRSTRSMNFIASKVGQELSREEVLARVSDVIDLNDLGLREVQHKDFIFRYYAGQLEDMPIPPTVLIADKIEDCITYSNRFNNLLIFNERYLPQMKEALSIEYLLRHIKYADFAKSNVRRLIVRVNETIRDYLKDMAVQNRRNKLGELP